MTNYFAHVLNPGRGTTVLTCKPCKGSGIVVKRLDPIPGEFNPDDGEEHPTRCWECKGAGRVDDKGNPYHLNTVHLGR